MFKRVTRVVAAVCLTASFSAFAQNATPSDHAVVSCKTANLLVSAFSTSYETSVNPSAGCAATLKALSNESMHILSTSTSSDTIVYTLGFFQY